jgi:hypothetical protein
MCGNRSRPKQSPTVERVPAYRGAIPLIAVQQIGLGVLSALMLDGGFTLRVFTISMLAYWLGFFFVLLRRYDNSTGIDRWAITWGPIILFATTFAIAVGIIHFRS